MSSSVARTSQSTSAETLVSIISHLGGPTIRPADIQVDLPAGKKLVEWLVDQLQHDENNHGYGDEKDRKLTYQAALEGIALDHEEAQMLKRLKVLPPKGHEEIDKTGYISPSGVRAGIAYMESESSLLESEAALLKHRLRQTKSVAQRTTQMVKSLKSALKAADGDFGERRDQIEELSISADASISDSTRETLQLLDLFKPKSEQGSTTAASKDALQIEDIDSHLATLSRLSTLRSSIINTFESQKGSLEEAVSLRLKAEDIKEEAGRLNEAFRKAAGSGTAKAEGRKHGSLTQAAQEATYHDELAKICESLDGGSTVEAILCEMDTGHLHSEFTDIDPTTEMENAWNLDQVCVLEAEGRIFDNALTAFTSRLIPSLRGLYDTLSKTDAHVRDAEAFVGVLGEEFEQVTDNIRRGVEVSKLSPVKDIEDIEDEALEVELIELLKRLKDLRRMDAPPLVLLDRTDVLTELQALAKQDSALERKEEEWANELPGLLGDLANTHTPFLSEIYAHSPVNTSPPFMAPPHLLSLENEARQKGDELAGVVRRLQKDVETLQSGRTTRKLGAFVEKWGRGS